MWWEWREAPTRIIKRVAGASPALNMRHIRAFVKPPYRKKIIFTAALGKGSDHFKAGDHNPWLRRTFIPARIAPVAVLEERFAPLGLGVGRGYPVVHLGTPAVGADNFGHGSFKKAKQIAMGAVSADSSNSPFSQCTNLHKCFPPKPVESS